ncbi:MAG: putative DNA binding domain-containing protein, partial [Eubacterium sp.]|nr:putative DNA binding domain-containing protein [Eubacterium sp.]
GKLIVGVDDKTHQIVGVENDVLFQLMDGIANAVSDSCVPQIIPDIEPQTVNGKTVIVVSVEAGKNRPYYLKSKGKDNGTYIRVAGTSRQAFPEKIKELEMEGARISWDELTCVGYPVSEEATEKLCQDIEKFRKKAGMSEHSVKKEQLINWKILKQSEGQLLATNAYALLTSDYFSFSKTQCAVFKGIDRAVFLDKREFIGPIYTQIEEAVDFVLRNIRLGATIDGLVRKEKYELPPEAIREMIINAHCHRNLLDESCIQVAVYDDRLEVTSPGGLYNGLTYEEVMNGHSKIRVLLLASFLQQLFLEDVSLLHSVFLPAIVAGFNIQALFSRLLKSATIYCSTILFMLLLQFPVL